LGEEREVAEPAGEYALPGRRAVQDDRRRRARRASVTHQALDELGDRTQAHIDAHGLEGPGKARPVEIEAPRAEMAGDENAAVRMVAMGEGNTGIGRAPQRRRHTRHDL